MIFRCLKVSLFLIASTAFAATGSGNRVGNGGSAVICRAADGKITSSEILDFYEASPKTYPSLANESGDLLDRAKKDLAARWEIFRGVHPRLATQFSKRLGEIGSEIEFRGDVRLEKVRDALTWAKPLDRACKLEQAAIRKEIVSSDEKRFVFDENAWKAFAPRSRAGLLSHEIIYEYFYRLGETDSRKARKLNELLWRDDFAKMSKEKYWEFIRELKLPIYD